MYTTSSQEKTYKNNNALKVNIFVAMIFFERSACVRWQHSCVADFSLYLKNKAQNSNANIALGIVYMHEEGSLRS